MLTVLGILTIVVVLFFSIVLHEYAHGWAAYKLGDPTAKEQGRLTLNPIKHIDPVGTIVVPGILLLLSLIGIKTFIFGWAKPVPVDFSRLRSPKRDMMLVGVAGPIVNIALAIIFSQIIKLDIVSQFKQVCGWAIFINLLLAVFNMIPIPPLDGSRIVSGVLPNRIAYVYNKLEPFGILIVFALAYLGIFRLIVFPVVDFLGGLLGVTFS